jgi:putative ABC transport system permease protein
MTQELLWAWRNLRARGARPVLAVGLLAVALAANTLVFAAADSLVFHRTPYPNFEQLIEIRQRDARTGQPGGTSLSPALLDEWRKQRDLVSGVEGYLSKPIFLSGAAEPVMVQSADVTTGLIDLLRVPPRWGRGFVADDARQTDALPALIAESLAIEQFGDPARAVGQRLQTTAEPLVVVGVMPAGFRFPTGTVRIWRALDPRGALAEGFSGVFSIARLAPGADLARVAPIMELRSVGVGQSAGARQGYSASPVPLRLAQAAAEQRRMLLVLVGAALSMLLIACANVASLELASAVSRARTYAIQLAVGASRAALVRTALFEGILLVGAAAGLAAAIARAGAGTLVAYFPPYLATNSANPIDVDERALLFMAAIAAAAWALSALPTVAFAGRANLLDLLKLEGSSVATSRGGARFRRALTVVQVALAVLLLVGTVLYTRSYMALLALDKGFDSGGVVSVSLTIPPQALGTAAERRVLAETLLARIRARPGVVAAFEGAPPPSTGDSPMAIEQIEVDDRGPMPANLLFPKLTVEPDYFTVLRIPLVRGRMFETGEPPTSVIISEALAARLWPGEDPVGHRFRESPRSPWFFVIGVVGHVRLTADGTKGPDRYFQLYFAKQPPPPPRPAPSAPGPATRRFGGPSFGFMTVTARVDSRDRTSDLYQTVRGVDPRNILRLQFVDDMYATQFADRLLATRIIGGFGVLSFLVAAAGIYSLMAFLVASRARELGIRVALGATGSDIRRLVLGSSLRLVAAGAAVGIASALAVSRWVQSQLFGVRPTDPLTLIAVTSAVITVALIATWQPARQAARVDPKELLKG